VNRIKKLMLLIALSLTIVLSGCGETNNEEIHNVDSEPQSVDVVENDIPDGYAGSTVCDPSGCYN
jgi:hypothetical protein